MPLGEARDEDEIAILRVLRAGRSLVVKLSLKEKKIKKAYFFEGKLMDLHRDIGDKKIILKKTVRYKRVPKYRMPGWIQARHHFRQNTISL